MVARVDDEPVAVVLLRYELDKSSVAAALQGKHAMVIDAVLVTPALTEPAQRLHVDAGVQRELRSLAACHAMRLTFASASELEAVGAGLESA